MSAARALTTWVSEDMYMVSRGPAATPRRRTFQPARLSRAALRAMKFAMAPPEAIIPPAPSGIPNTSCANQRVRASSISVAEGASRHAPMFAFSPAASRSAAAPGTVPAPEM